jgi:hypothetical protein
MSGAIPPLPQYGFMAWCSVKAQGQIYFYLYVLILSFHLRLGLPSGVFHSGFPTKILYDFLMSPMRDKCPTHLIPLDFITLMIFGEE